MNNRPKAINSYKNLCFKCLNKKKITKFSLYRGYGSSFDNYRTYLQICDDCKPTNIKAWFDEEPEMQDNFYEEYKHEKDITDLVDSFPLEGQELFWNRCAYGALADSMGSQDWIDMKLGILPDEKYKEYGMYSPTEKRLYEERYPTCNHPINIVHSDESKGSRCVFGASGKYGQEVGLNISEECSKCQRYTPRNEPIKDMSYDEYKLYHAYYIGKLNYFNLKDRFE
jgi:hypothetical protein